MRHIPLALPNGLMTRSGFEPNSLRVDLCCEVILVLATCGGGGVWLGISFWVCSRKSVRLVDFGSVSFQVEGL